MKEIHKLVLAVIGCELVGILSTPFTINAISTWYVYLNKPFFSPPNWIFAPVWTTLYFLMGVSLYLILINKRKSNKSSALKFFYVQLVLNFLWSFLFFALKSPLLGLLEICLLLIMILFTIKSFYKISKPAAYLLIPYMLWVSFASILNASVFLLNR